MNIDLPDPYPGRCLNCRTHRHPSGAIESLRCLDYEGRQHVCSFPEPRVESRDALGWNSQSVFATTPPKPWVKPGVVS